MVDYDRIPCGAHNRNSVRPVDVNAERGWCGIRQFGWSPHVGYRCDRDGFQQTVDSRAGTYSDVDCSRDMSWQYNHDECCAVCPRLLIRCVHRVIMM